MSGSKSKNKGAGAERELAKILSDTFKLSFIRTPHSGAMVGGSNAFRKEIFTEGQIRTFKADILPPEELSKFVIESKFYADFPFHAFVMNTQIPLLNGWIKDLEHDCDEGDFGIICIKINRKGWFVGCQEKYEPKLQWENRIYYNNYIFTSLESFFRLNKEEIYNLALPYEIS